MLRSNREWKLRYDFSDGTLQGLVYLFSLVIVGSDRPTQVASLPRSSLTFIETTLQQDSDRVTPSRD